MQRKESTENHFVPCRYATSIQCNLFANSSLCRILFDPKLGQSLRKSQLETSSLAVHALYSSMDDRL